MSAGNPKGKIANNRPIPPPPPPPNKPDYRNNIGVEKGELCHACQKELINLDANYPWNRYLPVTLEEDVDGEKYQGALIVWKMGAAQFKYHEGCYLRRLAYRI